MTEDFAYTHYLNECAVLQSESYTFVKKSSGERQTNLAGLGAQPNHTTAVQVDNLKNNVIGGMRETAAAIPSIAAGDINHLSTAGISGKCRKV
eukprot:826226-Prorocentrum_minimum.AAC.1